MGCVGGKPAPPAFVYKKKTFVVDVGGGSLCIYLNGVKVAAPAYLHDEYAQLTAKENWDVGPLMQMISMVIMNQTRNDSSQRDRKSSKGIWNQPFQLKVGITGSGRDQMDKAEFTKRIQSIYDKMQNMSSWANLSCGILSHDFESELEQKSAWDILDIAYPKNTCIVFNMGGSDSRIFSKEFALEFAGKGAKFATKDGYQAGPWDPETFSSLIQEQATLAPEGAKVLLSFCGFYGYFFSMIHFRALWKCILAGKPIPVAKAKKALRQLDLIIDQAEREEDAKVAVATNVEFMMNNKERKGTTGAQMLMSRRNQCEMALSFIDNMEKKLGADNIGGVIVDNKLGIHVRKHVPKEYQAAFDQHSANRYADLSMDGTFGTPFIFSWAIPLGMSDDFEVPATSEGTSALWVRKGEAVPDAM
jgi:hypothetical protein